MKDQQQIDNEALIATVQTLLQQIKQPAAKVADKQLNWVERYLGAPKSIPEIIWRLCWLAVVPAIVAFLAIPAGVWLWVNGFPAVVILAFIIGGSGYYAVYWFAASSAPNKKLERLVDIQMMIPPLVMIGVFLWEGLRYGG